MTKKLVIIGGEGNGGVVASCIEDNKKRFNDYEWEVAGFINDYEETVCGYPVIGKMDDVNRLVAETDYFFLFAIHTVGRNTLIEKTYNKINIPEERLGTVIHHSAFIADSAEIGSGSFVFCNCYVGPQVKLGNCCMLMANTNVGHNSILGPHCHVAVGGIVSSYDVIGKCTSIAFGTVVLEKRKIGDYCVAGANSVITHDIPDYEIHVGSPARFLKRIKDIDEYDDVHQH